MKINTHSHRFTVLTTAFLIATSSLPALAAIVQVNGDHTTGTTNFVIISTDLVNQGQMTLDSWTGDGGFAGDVNDGDGAISGTDFYGAANPTLTFFLDTSVNTYGYDITKVHTLAQWASNTAASQANQNFELLVREVGSVSFSSLGSYSHTPYTDAVGAHNASIELTESTGFIAEKVNAVRFVYTAAGASGLTLSEIDVIGVASVPEPSSTSFICLSLGSLLLHRRRR